MNRFPSPAWLALLGLGVVPAVALVVFLRRGPTAPAPPRIASTTVPVPSTRPEVVLRPPVDRTALLAVEGATAQARRLTEEARSIQRRDPAGSRALLRQALERDPRYEPALEALSVKLLHDENHAEARALSARCLEVSPENDACTMVQNYATPLGPELEAAGASAREAVEKNPADVRHLAVLVGYDVVTGKRDEAEKLAAELERISPGSKQTLLAQARVASVDGRYEDARHTFEEACRLGMEQACFRAEALRSEGW